MTEAEKEVENILCLFGIGPSYCGYRPLILSVSMALESEDRLLCISNSIYPTVITHLGGSRATIERNVRTISNQAWKNDRTLLEKIAGRYLEKPPSAKLFIEILYTYISRQT